MKKALFRRILLKVSGEAFGEKGFDFSRIGYLLDEIVSVLKTGTGLGIVLGGGNILRGRTFTKEGFPRMTSDYLGMLGTVFNGVILRELLEKRGYHAEVFSPLRVEKLTSPHDPFEVKKALSEHRIPIFAGGTGIPFVTTDTTAVMRALEIGADLLVKGTKVDGVYSSDPGKDRKAVKYLKISFREYLVKRLEVIDQTAVALAQQQGLGILVLNLFQKGRLLGALRGGKNIGTLIS